MPEISQVWSYFSPMVASDLPSFSDLHKCRSTPRDRRYDGGSQYVTKSISVLGEFCSC
jgi:hypothetical protein